MIWWAPTSDALDSASFNDRRRLFSKVLRPASRSLAGVLLFEQIWIMPMADAIERSGARIVTFAHVDPVDVIAALGTDDLTD